MNIIIKQNIPKSKFTTKCFNMYLSNNFKFVIYTKITSGSTINNKETIFIYNNLSLIVNKVSL